MPSLVPPQAAPADLESEYSTFLSPTFDPNSFAHSILNSNPSSSSSNPSSARPSTSAVASGWTSEPGDISAALAKLNFGVDDLNSQLKAEIGKHHEALLLQAASLGRLDEDLAEVRRGLGSVEAGVGRLRKKISLPHASLSSSLQLLTRLRRASSLAKRAARFTSLARKLQVQMVELGESDQGKVKRSEGLSLAERKTREKRETAMAQAALILAEIESLLQPPPGTSADAEDDPDDPEALLPISALDVVRRELATVQAARQAVTQEMMDTVQIGLETLDQPLLSSSLQTAHNLSVLPSLIESLLNDLGDLVARKVRAAFDLAALAREVGGKDSSSSAPTSFVYKSRARTEPTPATTPQWAAALWAKLEAVMSELGSVCVKVYTLEKVLARKRDIQTQLSFLDESLTVLDSKPSLMFWTTLAQALESQAKEAVRGSPFMQNTLSTGYPRLLRLLHEFFTKIAVHTDTIYTQSQQSPETVLVLRAVLPFEQLYLNRSVNRLTEAVSSSFSISSSLSSSFTSRPPTMPTANEGVSTARAIVNELDAARFDPLLVKAVAKGASRALETFVAKAEGLIAHDHSATSLLGPVATPAQHSNADLASSLYHLWAPLNRALPAHVEPTRELLKPSVERVRSAYLSISNPLILAIRRELSTIIARMHRVDYSHDNANPLAASSANSSYMVDLTDKLALVRDEILASFRVAELAHDWALDLARFTVQTFVLHASIVAKLGESGKLKLTQDATSLEFAISQYLASHGLNLSSMGDQFKALRAFRPLLFLADGELSDPNKTGDVPSLILIHHVLARSVLPLPGQAQGWSESEYVRWLNEHGEAERMKLVEGVLAAWEAQKEGRSEQEQKKGEEMVAVVRAIVDRSRVQR